MKHILKTWPEYYQAVWTGEKTFEIRVNDRNYQVGDLLVLQEFDPRTKEYTGSVLRKRVTYLI